MSTDYERLRLLRKYFNLSQTQFAEKLGVSRSVIKNLELGIVDIKEYMFKLISSTFNANENWLKTGEGDMFTAVSDNIVDKLVKEYDLDDVDASIIQGYLSLPASQRSAVKSYITNIISNIVSSSGADKPPSETPNRDDLIIQRIADTDKKLLDLMNKSKSNASDG